MQEGKRILIWGKTYPELSSKHQETVCTGGCEIATGRPIRLYPIPLRLLPKHAKYKLYDCIEVKTEKNAQDPRPESYKVLADPSILAHVSTQNTWIDRWRVISKDRTWHYGCLEDLKEAQRNKKDSLGFIKVGEVIKVWIKHRPEADRSAHEEKLAGLKSQLVLFGEKQLQDLEFQPFRIYLEWRCAGNSKAGPCPGHSAGILDWGLGQLGRKHGPKAAQKKVESLSDLNRYDFGLFVGNFRSYPSSFGIVGMWYPLRTEIDAAKAQHNLF